ncbi:NUDIX hydrolase [Streptococcus caprae]|uniref:NUDIX domain-containing protein n=1 Tax=Streptococcus caprae TaxID=1640501 RepID=A0ABV8CXA0_9STRE
MEKWDAYNREGQVTGQVLIRGQEVPNGLYHLVVECLILDQDDRVLLVQRHPDKPAFPSYFEASAGGSALLGESDLEAIIREVEEETGINLKADQLSRRETFFNEQFHCYFQCFTAKLSQVAPEVILQGSETTAYRWIPRSELKSFFKQNQVIPRHQNMLEILFLNNDA